MVMMVCKICVDGCGGIFCRQEGGSYGGSIGGEILLFEN